MMVMKLRDESPKEAIALARDAKLPVHVLGTNKAVLAEIDKARVQRVDISGDSYSYAQLIQDKAITLERAIQRMSAAPAGRLGLSERGSLRKGLPADIVVFSPSALSAGMKYVFVNGVAVVKDGAPTDARPGRALR
jgi:adenine deaminase